MIFLIISIVSIILFSIITFIYIEFNSIGENSTISSNNIKKKLTNKETIIKIKLDEDAQHPRSMELKMSGEINGVGILKFGWNDSIVYKTDTIKNNYSLDYFIDWYNDICIIKYVPITATKGNLSVSSKVYSSKK